MYKRAEYQVITSRLKEPRKFIQVVMGPPQILLGYHVFAKVKVTQYSREFIRID